MKRRTWIFVGVGLLVSMLLAGVVSYYASSSPDGLEKVAGDVGFLDSAEDSAVSGSPLSDYGVEGIADERLSVGISGIIGIALVAIVAFGLFLWLGRRSRSDAPHNVDVGA